MTIQSIGPKSVASSNAPAADAAAAFTAEVKSRKPDIRGVTIPSTGMSLADSVTFIAASVGRGKITENRGDGIRTYAFSAEDGANRMNRFSRETKRPSEARQAIMGELASLGNVFDIGRNGVNGAVDRVAGGRQDPAITGAQAIEQVLRGRGWTR